MGKKQTPHPSEAFTALAKRYAIQRSRGVFPSGMFLAAQQMEWVPVNTPASQLEPPTREPLSDGELSALVDKPVFDIRIAPTPHTPKRISWKLSKAGARAHWKMVKQELKKRMGEEMYSQIDKPHEMREEDGSEISAYSFAIDMKSEPNFPPPPPLPEGHLLKDFKLEVKWPPRRRSYVSDVTVIRIHPTNFGPKDLWQHLNSLPDRLHQMMPRQDDTYLILQSHELGHARQPQPDQPTHTESYYGEYDADDYMAHICARLGVKRGNIETFHAARSITSIAYTNAYGSSAWSCHTTTPALYFGGFDTWPIAKLNALRKVIRGHTDMLLVGEGFNLAPEEVQAFTAKNEKYFKQFDKRKEEVSRQLGRARLAEAKVASKPGLMAERRLLALKKMWNDQSLKMDQEMLVLAGNALEGAALFWPDLKDPKVRLTPAKTTSFRPRKKPAAE